MFQAPQSVKPLNERTPSVFTASGSIAPDATGLLVLCRELLPLFGAPSETVKGRFDVRTVFLTFSQDIGDCHAVAVVAVAGGLQGECQEGN